MEAVDLILNTHIKWCCDAVSYTHLAPNYDHLLVLGVSPEKAPDVATEISISFEKGIPVALNGKEMKYSEIVTELNKIGGANGIGIVDIVENRVVGMKSRGV